MSGRKPKLKGEGTPLVTILVPSMEQWYADFGNSLLTLCANLHHTIDSRYSVINERGSLITYQRERLAEMGLDKGSEWLLWLDSDMMFPPDLFNRLEAHGKPIVGCNYVKRIIPATPNSKTLDNKFLLTNEDSTGLEEAASAGFGAMLTHRSVFDGLPQPWFDTVWYHEKKGDKPQLMGEDVFFFKKVRALKNIPLWIDHDTSKSIKHIGSFEYTNNLASATLFMDQLGNVEHADKPTSETLEESDNPELERSALG